MKKIYKRWILIGILMAMPVWIMTATIGRSHCKMVLDYQVQLSYGGIIGDIRPIRAVSPCPLIVVVNWKSNGMLASARGYSVFFWYGREFCLLQRQSDLVW